MKVKLSVLAGVLAVTIGLAAVAATLAPSAQAAPPGAGLSSTITPAQSGGILNGTFTITNVTTEAGHLVANGVFTGTENGQPVIADTGQAPINAPAAGSCRILDLTLGPLHLDLLGLIVDLNQVHLTITAQRGPGNLLGNLLCAVAGLLDGGGNANAIQNLLDQINAILGRL
jgi:hypothetical protein